MRTDHRADVATIEHRAALGVSKFLLEIEQCSTDVRDCRHDGSSFPNSVGLELRLIELTGIDCKGSLDHVRPVFQLVTRIEYGLCNRTVEQTGVKVWQAIVLRQSPGDRPLSGGCRSINRHDHARSAPSERIRSGKPGKLVATNDTSSACTGLSAPTPSINPDMAIR